MTADAIKMEAARRVARMSGLSAQERRAETARIEADLQREAQQAEQARAAAAVAAEAQAERARIAAVVKVGADMGRARQAARLAISTALEAVGAKALLSTLPTDMQAAPEALAIPSEVGTFGSPAAQVERKRIGAVLACPEAVGRFSVAAAIATETTLDAAQAIAALMAAPRQEARASKSLAERSREAGEFGASFNSAEGKSKAERTTEMWSRAVAAANASIGAAPTGPAADAVPLNPGITDAERAALRGAAGLVGAALADLARG